MYMYVCVVFVSCNLVVLLQGERLQLDRLVNTFSSSGVKFQNLQQVGINWT